MDSFITKFMLKNQFKCSEEMLFVLAITKNHFFAFWDDGRPMHLICDTPQKVAQVVDLSDWEFRKVNDEEIEVLHALCKLWSTKFQKYSSEHSNKY